MEGYNVKTPEEVSLSLNGECVDFSNQFLLGAGNFEAVSFRGANLENVGFPPYNAPIPTKTSLQGANIRGAHDLYGLRFGGKIDTFTSFDIDRCEINPENLIRCQ
jgi:hypothetical protein